MSLVEIEIDSKVKVADLFLNRPEKLNAFNAPLIEAFTEAFDSLVANPQRLLHRRQRARVARFSTGYDMSRRDQPRRRNARLRPRSSRDGRERKRASTSGCTSATYPSRSSPRYMDTPSAPRRCSPPTATSSSSADDAVFGWAGGARWRRVAWTGDGLLRSPPSCPRDGAPLRPLYWKAGLGDRLGKTTPFPPRKCCRSRTSWRRRSRPHTA